MSVRDARREPTYRISAVAARYELHPQTLRTWEREGLLRPSRSRGNTRLYTARDLERLEVILHLTRDLGVNLAGVEVILHMRERMSALQEEASTLVEAVRRRLAELDPRAAEALTPFSGGSLVRALDLLGRNR